MAHNVEHVNGKASFFSNRHNAWWDSLGSCTVDGALTSEEAIVKAGMDWEVIKEQMVHPRSGEVINAFGIYRSDNDAFLGVVGDRYTPIQNRFQFSTMDAIIGSDTNGAHYETAGVLGKGERVFMLANMTDEYNIHGTGDIHRAYLAGVGSHDGSSSQRFFVTETRIVCQNTLQMALGKAGNAGIKVRHTANAESRINAKLGVMQSARKSFKDTMEKLEWLAEKRLDTATVVRTIADIFGVDATKELPTKTLNSINTIKELFETNDNDAFPEFRGSAYNLLNAVTEYTDHFKPVRMTGGREGQTIEMMRTDSAVFGLGSDFKSKALDIIIENAQGAPTRSLHKLYSVPSPAPTDNVLDSILAQY